jgi:hypothetical protein
MRPKRIICRMGEYVPLSLVIESAAGEPMPIENPRLDVQVLLGTSAVVKRDAPDFVRLWPQAPGITVFLMIGTGTCDAYDVRSECTIELEVEET